MDISRRLFLNSTLGATGLLLTGGGRMTLASSDGASADWWRGRSIRWIQTNLRETDAAIDPVAFVDEIAALHANTALVNAGGITAYYPTDIKFAHVSEFLPKGTDLFGEIVKEAHKRDIRIVSRWDFSKARKEVFDAHPDWFFKMADGGPAIYNGLYQVCINGGWMQEKAPEILAEAFDRYAVDGAFFNNFLNPFRDYAGANIGICQCVNCQRLHQEQYGRPVPQRPDRDYLKFIEDCGRGVSEKIIALMNAKRPSAAMVGGSPLVTDIVYGESSTAIDDPLPLWPYTASDNVNKWRNSYPQAEIMCQSMQYLDFQWRYNTVPRAEIATRIWQSVAHGGFAALSLNGTIGDLKDRAAVATTKGIFQWLKEHDQFYHSQINEARVILLAPFHGGQSGAGFAGTKESYRGMFRLLSEEHIPFASMANLNWLGKRPADLVITTGPVPAALPDFVRAGGNLLVTGTMEPEFEIAPIVKRWKDLDGAYIGIGDKTMFPALGDTDIAMIDHEFVEVQADGDHPLTFIPPSLYAPPEYVGKGWADSGKPALVIKRLGKGTIAWLPWDISGHYHRYSLESHRGILTGLIDHLLPKGRDIQTNAHPLVQMSLMRQGGRHMLHMVNMSGHSDTAYYDPLPMESITIAVKGRFTRAHALRSGRKIAVRQNGEFATFEVPSLNEYEVIVLQ